ncbi:unnamed protein product [Phytophthora lilii]|uniref:Unnamed protein product n=1 Tax=Phytophthora lilii TaxID=2077276 RepID=A0A9W6WPD1_9STRA|nr:unnamed protein product [Phytophthora lilii]
MNESPLCSPQAPWFSDCLIGEVLTRRTKQSSHSASNVYALLETNGLPQTFDGMQQMAPQQTFDRASNSASTTNHTTVQCSPRQPNVQAKSFLSKEVTDRALQLYRLRRRRAQQRYRKKIDNKASHLEDDIAQFETEVNELKLKKLSIPQTVRTTSTPWEIVVEYFRLFRKGFKPSLPVAELSSANSALYQDKSYVQVQFFQAVVAPDVQVDAGFGVQTALEDWRLVTLHHENLVYDLVRMEKRGDDCVFAEMNGIITITENMLDMALADITVNEGKNKWKTLASKLLGQRLVVPSTMYFCWSKTNTRIVRAHYEADMLTPLLKLLRSMEDTACVLNSALNIHHFSGGRSHNGALA